jgi:hypothetical protein
MHTAYAGRREITLPAGLFSGLLMSLRFLLFTTLLFPVSSNRYPRPVIRLKIRCEGDVYVHYASVFKSHFNFLELSGTSA